MCIKYPNVTASACSGLASISSEGVIHIYVAPPCLSPWLAEAFVTVTVTQQGEESTRNECDLEPVTMPALQVGAHLSPIAARTTQSNTTTHRCLRALCQAD